MMSTAISMTFGTELGKENHVCAGGEDAPETSFAESFDERVGFSSVAEEKESVGTAVSAGQELRNVKRSSQVSTSNEMVVMSDDPKGKSKSKQELSGSDANKSTVLGRAPITLIDGIVRPQPATDHGTVNSAVADEPATEVESTDDRDVSGATVAVETKGENFAGGRDIEFGNEPIARSSQEISIKNDLLEGEPELVTSAKKTAKERSPELAKPSETKTVVAVRHPVAALAKTEGIGAAPSAVEVAVGLNVAQIASNQTLQIKPEEVVTGTVKLFAARLAISGESSAPKNVTRDAKSVDVGSPATNGDSVAPQQVGAGDEKSSGVIISANGEESDKTLSIPAPTMVIVHAMAGGVGIFQGDGPDGFSQSGPQAEGIVSKLQNAEKAASGVGLQAGTAAPESFGGVTSSIDGAPHMLTATPTALEVGIQNGTHGWLKVRAEMADGGAVSATVSAATSAGQEMLHRELPAITAYLQQEKLAVSSVAVHITAATGADSKQYSEGRQSGGEEMSQRSDQGGRQLFERNAPNVTEEITTYETSNGVGVDGQLTAATYAVGGNWLSVRA
jgi:hypothetical protein